MRTISRAPTPFCAGNEGRPGAAVNVDEPFLTRHAGVVFALKTFAAAMLALIIALWLDLSRPYWAMTTVYITSQPLAGETSSKAFYRLLGTLLGASATVAMLPNFVDAAELLSLVIALWVGLCLYLSLLDGTPRSYVFMLAGYTAAFVGFPEVSEPASIFNAALARAEEISLGIICASLVSTVAFPRSVATAVATRVDNWLSDARRLSQHVLGGPGSDQAARDQRLRIAAEAVEIDTLATHLAYDRTVDFDTARGLRTLHLHMLMLLPLLASIGDFVAALQDGLQTKQPALGCLLDDLAKWVATEGRGPQSADTLRAAIAAQQPKLETGASWDRLMVASLLIRLRELVDISQDCRALRHAIAAGDHISKVELKFGPEAGVAPIRHRDHGMALWSGAGAVIAILISCGFWIASGWPDGATAPMMAAVGFSLFAVQDDPAPSIHSFACWSILGIAVVAVYLFAVLPRISNVEMLVAMLAPPFVLFGILIARPATAFIGIALAITTATLLALQSSYSADFAAFINSSVSYVIGLTTAAVVTRLVRSVGAAWSAKRLMRTNRATLAVAAERRGRRDRTAFAGLVLNRVGLLAPRYAAIPESDLRDVDRLCELRVGLNIIDLRRVRRRLAPQTLRAVDDMLDQLAVACRRHSSGPMPPELLARIDVALTEAMTQSDDDVRGDALIGLVGIRRGLFPDALTYQPEYTDPSTCRTVAA
jgi:uncharacterized membrane protein YccC